VGSLDMAALFAAGTDFAVFHRRDDADLHLLHYVVQESQVGFDAPPVAFPVASSGERPPDLDHSADGCDLWEEIPNTSNQTTDRAARALRRRQLYREAVPETPSASATRTIIARRIARADTEIGSPMPTDVLDAFNAADDPSIPVVATVPILTAAASLVVQSQGFFSAEDVAAFRSDPDFSRPSESSESRATRTRAFGNTTPESGVDEFADACSPVPHHAGLFTDPHYSSSPASRTSSSLFTSATFLQFFTCATDAPGPCLAHALLLGNPADPTANVDLIRQNRRLLRRAANTRRQSSPTRTSQRQR
jgi:hypothetical protein